MNIMEVFHFFHSQIFSALKEDLEDQQLHAALDMYCSEFREKLEAYLDAFPQGKPETMVITITQHGRRPGMLRQKPKLLTAPPQPLLLAPPAPDAPKRVVYLPDGSSVSTFG